jgi:serine/threonine protein kinase
LTEASRTVLGTIGYMAPEQVRGERAQPGSDIFSLGCVLYEMVTGRRAFSGKSATEIMAAVLKEDPLAVADSGKASSPEFNRVLERCLAKSPAQRFHSAEDLAFALASLSTSSGQPSRVSVPRRTPVILGASVLLLLILAGTVFYYSRTHGSAIDSVAVLPFVNTSGSQDADWLSDGLTDSLIDSLSGLPDLKIMSHSAVFRYRVRMPTRTLPVESWAYARCSRAI